MVRPYTVGKPFRFWCQKILPLVYDDSLSYYELLNKVVDYLNKVINNVNSVGEAFNNLQTAFDELSNMVDNYFDNLDVQQEINNKLDEMAEDGTLDALIQPLVDSAVSDAVSEWLEENVNPTGSAVVVDSSLTVSGAAADAKVTGDEIRDLKNAINGESTSVNYTEGYGLDSHGELYEDATKCVSELIPISDIYAGQNRFYGGTDISTAGDYYVAFYDSELAFIQAFQLYHSTAEYRNINYTTQVSQGTPAYVRFSFQNGYPAKITNNVNTNQTVYWETETTTTVGIIERLDELESDVEELQEQSADIELLKEKTLAPTTIIEEVSGITWTSGYVTRRGLINTSDTYVYSSSIPVNVGDTVKSSSNSRFITAYSNGTAVENDGAENVTEYIVPTGIDSVVITILAIATKQITRTYTELQNSLTARVEALEQDVEDISETVTATAQTVTDSTVTALENADTRKNVTIDFRGDITDFTTVTVGHGYQINYGVWAVIDSSNVTIYANEDSEQMAQYAHGLTINHYIHVLIQQADTTGTIIIESASGRFKQENIPFNSRRGNFFATVNGTLTNVSVSAVLHDLNKSVWMFGDSYQSIGDPRRYPYYLKQDGYLDNCLMSGFPGANASHQLVSFRKLISIGHPKYVVWALGMNGADSESAINASWKSCTDEVISTCANKNITVILCTIPNVPERIQTFKNAYVKESGERYIDFAKAVGAESQGSTWYSGMLSNDNLHPDTNGAIALYSELLADFPEIMDKSAL